MGRMSDEARAQRRRQCGHKLQLDTIQEAMNMKRQLFAKDGEPMVIYVCKWCGFYHLAHAEPKELRGAA